MINPGEEVADAIHVETTLLRGWRWRAGKSFFDFSREQFWSEGVWMEAPDQALFGKQRGSEPLLLSWENPRNHDDWFLGGDRFHHGVVSTHGDDQIRCFEVLFEVSCESEHLEVLVGSKATGQLSRMRT